MQAEDEILSLQAEMEDAFVRAEASEARAKHFSEKSSKLKANVDQLKHDMAATNTDYKAQISTLKAAYNSAVVELNESKTVGRQLLEQMSSVEEELKAKINKDNYTHHCDVSIYFMFTSCQGGNGEKGNMEENVLSPLPTTKCQG